MAQLAEVLGTGGVGAHIPIIQRAVEAATAAAGQSEETNRRNTARAGLTGTSFDVGNQLSSETSTSADIAKIGPEIAAQMIGAAPGIIQGQTALGVQGMGNLAAMDLSRKEFNSKVLGDALSAIQNTVTGWYGGSTNAGAGTSTNVTFGSTGGTPQTASQIAGAQPAGTSGEVLMPGGSPSTSTTFGPTAGVGGAGGAALAGGWF